MTTPSDLNSLTPDEVRDYGFARVRDAAFDAVSSLWMRRQAEGMTQADLANAINADAGWVSKNMRGPGNWTLKTFGALVEALRGRAEIHVRAEEDPLPVRGNYHAYVDYPDTTADSSNAAAAIASASTSSVPGQIKDTVQPVVTTVIQ